tara:strand:+ start:246 stop:629 length:384 start_codon:yes stop_codon:yes gene_type:complete
MPKKTKKNKIKIKKGGSNNSNINIINHRRFSTGNPTYKNMVSKGLVHITEAVGVNIARDFGSGLANLFGSAGFESKLYDEVKKKAFDKLIYMMSDEKLHVCNIKIDIETDKNTIFCHLVGTIYMKQE